MERQTTSPFTVRLDSELRSALEESARNNGNSLQVEVVNRLRDSLGMVNNDDERIRRIALELIRDELSKAGLVPDAPEHETGFSIPMQRRKA
ncbi:Arc family DNA-binding protein [Thiothrix unzii]|uniref:Arc family DNA-binding protein n=1 Tax=Thiothrix unzii TaxID=111769 RepID=A0A975F7C6_9GAMM|nr:Arc family DNA-binding protein [Thiothrix unzii]QTR52289.1 Arc family DNA-binding protein [Thiothrix unzii]